MDNNNYRLSMKANPKATKHQAALYLKDKYKIITVSGRKESIIFLYDNGVYIDGEFILRKELQNMLGEEGTTSAKNEILNQLKDFTHIDISETMKDDYYLIPVKNGVYDFKNNKLIDFQPDHFFFSKLPITYNPEAECPLHIKFFGEVLEEHDIPLIQEMLGFTLFRKLFLKKAFILVGEKNTGKSTFLKCVTNMIGIKNIAGVSLQKLSNDKFSIGNLFRKHVNLYDDLDEQGINNHGAFKIASGGGLVSGEKKFGDEFQFISYAKSIFACNKIPDVKNIDDDAYFDRWIIINFNRKIEKFDIFLDEKLSAEEEISGLLNWALTGLRRLLENRKFTNSLTSEETKKCMLKNSNTIAAFVQDCLEKGDDGPFILNEEMYEAYHSYCLENNLTMQSEMKFHRDLDKYANFIIKNTSALNRYGKQMRGYSGAMLNIKKTFINSEGDEITF